MNRKKTVSADRGRRSFIKKSLAGAALATPILETLTKAEVLANPMARQSGVFFTITSSRVDENGTITPLGAVLVPQGATQSFDVMANNGYQLVELVVDGATTLPNVISYTHTFPNVQGNHWISVHFHAT